MIKPIWLSLPFTLAGLALPSAAHAAVLGDALTCAVTGGGTFQCNTATNTLQAGTEFTFGNAPGFDFLGADFGVGALQISALQDSSLGATILNFSNLTSPITTFSLIGTSGFSGFNVTDVALSNGLLTIDLRGTENTAGGFINLALGSGGAVPEPSTWVMLLIGFGALGASMRGRRQKLTVSYA
jgi:hypothetical protein